MRTARRIKQKMFYSMHDQTYQTYERDKEGNIIYDIIKGEYVPRTTGEPILVYGEPVEFYNSISGQLTEDEINAFGSEKIGNAKMTYHKNEFPFKTGTLIWKDSEVQKTPQGFVDEESADYIVLGVLKAGKHLWRCILTENVKNEKN